MSVENTKIAIEHREKFHFYLTALVFTVLGFVIQTSPDVAPPLARIAELTGWLLLLVAGLAGLSYLEWSPTIRIDLVALDRCRNEIKHFENLKGIQTHYKHSETGVVGLVTDRLDELRRGEGTISTRVTSAKKRLALKYDTLRWGFVSALTAIAVARGSSIFLEILSALR